MSRLEDLAESLLGEMRDTTPEESEALSESISKISEPTGVNFWDLVDGKKIVPVNLKIDKVYKHKSNFDFEEEYDEL